MASDLTILGQCERCERECDVDPDADWVREAVTIHGVATGTLWIPCVCEECHDEGAGRE